MHRIVAILLVLMCSGLVSYCCSKEAFTRAPANLDVVMYWGQNFAGISNKNLTQEKSLEEVCQLHYSTVLISFAGLFFGNNGNHTTRTPPLNLIGHCTTLFPGYKFLLHCPEVAHHIKNCQSRGKKVLISMGGVEGNYDFDSEDEARSFALVVWNMYLGGKDEDVPRPFDDVILDGVDLSIYFSPTQNYPVFINKLRELMDASGKHYELSGTPTCRYPSEIFGPWKGSILSDSVEAFDHLNIQIYVAGLCIMNQTELVTSWNSWTNMVMESNPQLKLRVGLTAELDPLGYVKPSDLRDLFGVVAKSPVFSGATVWEQSWSQNNMVTFGSHKLEYGEFVYSLLMSL